MDIARSCSSSSKSATVEPSSTLPNRLVAPASKMIASQRLVLPQPRCPIRATLRMRSGGLAGTARTLLREFPGRQTARSAGEIRAEGEDRLGVDLRDARLGDAEDLADLPQGQVLVVVEGDDQAF